MIRSRWKSSRTWPAGLRKSSVLPLFGMMQWNGRATAARRSATAFDCLLSEHVADRFGSIALLQSFEQRPVDSFFASAGIADARTSASEISARRARRCVTSAVPWNQSFRMWRYERMNGCSWPTAVIPRVRRNQPLGNQSLAAPDSLRARLGTHTTGPIAALRTSSQNSPEPDTRPTA